MTWSKYSPGIFDDFFAQPHSKIDQIAYFLDKGVRFNWIFDHSNDNLLICRLFSMRGVSPDGRNTVQGTFDDLSEEEKTRAYLQFLQYHQQLEQENETKKFQQMLNQGNILRGIDNFFSAARSVVQVC